MDNPLEDADQPIGVDIGDFLTRVDDVQQIRKRIQKADSPQTGLDSYRKGRYESKEAAKMEVLGLLRQGMTITAAMEVVNRQRITFYGWCRESTKFRQQADEAMLAYQRTLTLQEMNRSQLNEAINPVRPENFRNWVEYQVAFRKAYFGHDTFDHHWAMLEAIDKAPVGGVTMILIPPMSGKTTLTLDIICADFCADPNTRACFISGGLDFSIKQMQRLQRRLVVDGTPTPFIQHFGPFPPTSRDSSKKWNSQEITILGSTHDESDPTVGAYGITGNIRGTRWNRMYLDDVQSLRTKNLTTGMVEVFRGDIMTRPVKSGKILITGSRVGRGDFYEEMERLELVDEIVVIPAMDYSKPAGSRSYFPLAYTPDGQAITDESGDQMGFSDAWMETRRKQVGEDQWSRVYMMKPQSDHSAMLTEGDISNATDQDRFVGERPREAIANIASLDPSLAAYAAFTNCSYNVDHLYVVDVKNFFKPTTNQALYAEIEARTVKFRPDYWVIENNTLQRGYLTDDAFLAIKDRYGFNAVGHHTGDNKRDSVLGIPAMMNAIVRGEIRFPRITENDTDFAVLFDQLMSWRPDIPTRRLVQDMVMSLWFSYLLWRELREQAEMDLSGWQRDGLDSITMYSHAKTNIDLPQNPASKRVAMTYDQTWQQLAGTPS